MAKHGKKFTAAAAQVKDRLYSIEEAIPLIQKVKYAKFDETVEMAMRLGVDPKHAGDLKGSLDVIWLRLSGASPALLRAIDERERDARTLLQIAEQNKQVVKPLPATSP